MSTVYNGVPGNITAVNAIAATIPADGDALAAASVNAALQKLTDYVAYLGQSVGPPGLAFWAPALPNTASTTYYCWAGYTTTAPGTGIVFGVNALLPPVLLNGGQIRLKGLMVAGTSNLVGGTVTATVLVNNVATALTVTIGIGSLSGIVNTGSVTTSPGNDIAVSLTNNVGVTTSLGNTRVVVTYVLN